jgi:hypothetical protein
MSAAGTELDTATLWIMRLIATHGALQPQTTVYNVRQYHVKNYLILYTISKIIFCSVLFGVSPSEVTNR